MTATAHALAAGVIASSVSDPTLGLTLSFISHPILDLVPHWDFGNNWRHKAKSRLLVESVTDLIFGIGVTYLLFGQNLTPWYFWGAVLLSEVWDILEAPYWFLGWKFFPFAWIYGIQSRMQGRLKLPWGLFSQLAVVALFAWVLKAI